MKNRPAADGIHGMLPRRKTTESARRLRDAYSIVPGAPLFQKWDWYYCLARWKEQGLAEGTDLGKLFGFEPSGNHSLGQLGWCEAALSPAFEERVVEDRGDYEVILDYAGRHILCFKGRRFDTMPEYLEHPVKDRRTWEEDVKWRLDPTSKERRQDLAERMAKAKKAAGDGLIITQNLIGGYMYLRSLIGPVDLLYKVYDDPELIHDCMKTWLELSDAVITSHQEHVTIDEFFIGEDICYNHGPLISPDMIREFLFPYYQQLMSNIRSRQIDKERHLYFQLDTDGFSPSVIPLYMSIGMDIMSPFEVASGCDVVEIGRQYPDLVIIGGFDKRIMAVSKKAIDDEVDRIFPVMRERGGYIPGCDHGVPEEVTLENYLHYRKRCLEFAE